MRSDDPLVAAALDYIALEFSPPLAEGLFGEVFPSQVEPGVEHEFSYFLQARSAPHGFDRIALEAPSALRFIEALVDGESAAVSVDSTEGRFALAFSAPIRRRQLVELRFATSVFVQATRFVAFLEDGEIRQRVDPGNASRASSEPL